MKMMSMAKQIRIQKKQNRNRMVGQTFSTLSSNERRRTPWLGGSWYEEGRETERGEFIQEWHEETERLLTINPNLKIIG